MAEEERRTTVEKDIKRIQINLEDAQKALRKEEERYFEQKGLKDSLQRTLDDLQERHGVTVVENDAVLLEVR